MGCHSGRMKEITEAQQQVFDHLKQIRAQAVEHARLARRLSAERHEVIEQLLAEGFSQADVAREMGVTRQAVQKMIAAG
jgi:DNA-binding NarL/FixJ family response regulator